MFLRNIGGCTVYVSNVGDLKVKSYHMSYCQYEDFQGTIKGGHRGPAVV